MADPNQNPLPDPKIIDQARDKYKGLKDVMQEALGIQKSTADILRESLRDLEKEIKSYDKINARLDVLKLDTINIKELEKEISVIGQKKYINQKKLEDLQKEQAKRSNEINQAQQNLNKQKLSGDKTLIELAETSLKFRQHELDVALLSTEEAKAAIKLNETQLKFTEDLLKTEKKINKELGLSGHFMDVFAKKLGLGNQILADMVEYTKKAELDKRKISKWDTFIVGVKSAGRAIKENLNDPLVQLGLVLKAQTAIWNGIKKAFNFIVDIAKKAYTLLTDWNTSIFEFAKNLGIGEQAARGLQNSFLNMANTSGDLYFNTKQLRDAYITLTEASGLFLENTVETTETAAILQRQFGLTSEHMQSIMENSSLSGKSFKDTYYTINSIRIIEGNRTKTLMTQRQMMSEISKVSSLILLNFKGNVPALAAAVVKAKALGMDLNQVASTANGFLDFESSISKEFEAQLFTGKDLNLQRLRYLSMTHDTAGLMAEIGKRIPSLLQFEKMNTFERQTYAEALNMSEESLAEIIKKQELNRKYGIAENATAGQTYNELVKQKYTHDQIVDILGEQAAQQDRSASIADRWNSVVDNIKDTLGQMLEGEMGGIIKAFQDMIKNSGGIQVIMGKIKSVVHSIANFFQDLPNAILKVIDETKFWLHMLAGGLAIIGGAMLLSPVTAPAGVGLLVGAAKLEALALGAGYLGGKVEQFTQPVSVSGAAVNAASTTSNGSSTSAQASRMPAGNVSVTIENINEYDGFRASPVIKKYNFGTPVDNVTNIHGRDYNISVSGK